MLEELEQLRNVQAELTQQVTELTTELEKERSKVHALKAELEKHEIGKNKVRNEHNFLEKKNKKTP